MGIEAEKSGSHGDSEQEQLYGSACGCVKNSYLKRYDIEESKRGIPTIKSTSGLCTHRIKIMGRN